MNEQTNLSQAARDAADNEMGENMEREQGNNSGYCKPRGYFVQRAMDAAVAEAVAKEHEVIFVIQQQRDRLTKELAEERAKRAKDCSPRKHCQVCHWTNTGCWNIGSELGAFWICQGCAKRQHEQRTREVIGEEFMVKDEALQRSYAELKSALAEKEKELAQAQNRTCRLREKLGLMAWQSFEEAIERLPKELSTERAAREKAERELRHLKLDAVENAPMKHALDMATVEMLNALRAQLQQSTDEIARLTAACAKEFADVERLSRKLQQSEQEVKAWRDEIAGTASGATFTTIKNLRAAVAQAEQERDEARLMWVGDVAKLKQEHSSLRAELAATQETALRVEADRDWWKEAQEATRQGAQLLDDERDALQKQNAALTSELAAVRICFAEASQSAGPTTVHVEKLKARNAELVKALEAISKIDDPTHDAIVFAKVALNQSSESI